MKIGIVTFHRSDNAGAVLQAYALRKWLLDHGHEAEFVDYLPDHLEKGGSLQRVWDPAFFKANLKIAYLRANRLYQRTFGSREHFERLAEFQRRCLNLSAEPIAKTLDELAKASLRYDLLICGSDQIWNPSDQFGLDPVYFLNFPAKAVRRISYAASFGGAPPPERFAAKIKSYLQKLDAVSVRERSATTYVAQLTGRDAREVVDPTLLHSDYSSLIKGVPILCDGRLFAYILRTGEGVSPMVRALEKRLQTSCCSAYNPHRRWRDFGEPIMGGPDVWLANLAAAKFVLTNSFHATVFSLIMKRPFAAISLPGKRAHLGGRVAHLLSEVGLPDRIVRAGDVEGVCRLSTQPVDWERVHRRLEDLRQGSVAFLLGEIRKTEDEL